MEETFFYHSFPRPREGRSKEETVKLGLDVIRMVEKHGLLLVPEKQSIRGIEMMQRRICFTALSPSELPKHALVFGSFAIEYTTEVLLKLGALPAIYLPELAGGEVDLGDAGMRLLRGLGLVEHVLIRLKNSDDPIAKTIGAELAEMKTDLHNLRWVPTIAQNLFYPAGSRKYDTGLLGYYEQREWKIIENFTRLNSEGKPVWDFVSLTDDQKIELVTMNSWLNAEIQPGLRRIDGCMLFPRMAETSVVSD